MKIIVENGYRKDEMILGVDVKTSEEKKEAIRVLEKLAYMLKNCERVETIDWSKGVGARVLISVKDKENTSTTIQIE